MKLLLITLNTLTVKLRSITGRGDCQDKALINWLRRIEMVGQRTHVSQTWPSIPPSLRPSNNVWRTNLRTQYFTSLTSWKSCNVWVLIYVKIISAVDIVDLKPQKTHRSQTRSQGWRRKMISLIQTTLPTIYCSWPPPTSENISVEINRSGD